MSFTRADSIIRESCEMDGDGSLSTYRQREILALDCIQNHLKFRVIPETKTIEVTISSTGRLPYPADYITWNRIGTLEGDRIKVYAANGRLALFNKTDSNGNPINNKKYHPDFLFGWGYPFSGGYGGYGTAFGSYTYYADTSFAIYGYGNGVKNDGHFIDDQATQAFQFSSELAGKTILLEYVTTGLNPSGDTMVPTTARLCVKHYIRWQRALNNKTTAAITTNMYADEFWNEYRMVMRGNIDMGKIVSVLRDSFKTTPKT